MVEKNKTIQIMRGLAIIIVLIRHAIAQINTDIVLDITKEIIICFHMPVFFVIAGYLFQNGINKYIQNGKLNFIFKKAKHLLVPYAFWTILLWIGVQVACSISPSILNRMITIGFAPMNIGDLIYGLFTYQIYYTEHLWFLYVLFLLFVINIITVKKGDAPISILIWCLIGIATLYTNLPHIIERTMLWGIFFSFGRFVKSSKYSTKIGGGLQSIWILLIFLMTSAIYVTGLYFEINGTIFTLLMQINKYFVGFSGVGVVYVLSITIKNTRIGKVLNSVGDYSFDIYLMHNPYFVALSALVLNQIIGLSAYVVVIMATLLGILLPMLISRFVIRKSKLLSMVMIGK